jgi:hypothetical protein
MATAKVKTGDEVEWKFGSGKAKGKVTKVHTSDVERTIKGSKVKREASAKKPAVEVKTKKGGKALKSSSEVKKA